MSVINPNPSTAVRQPATLPARYHRTEFETDAAWLWGIAERRADNDDPRDRTISARLDMIIQVKNHRTKLDDLGKQQVTKRELEKFFDGHGQWLSKSQPDIFAADDPTFDGFEMGIPLSTTQWWVTVYVSAVDNDDHLPLGYDFYWSERGVR